MKKLYYKLLAWWKNFNQKNNPVILAVQPITPTYFAWMGSEGLEDDWSSLDGSSEIMMACGFPREAFEKE